MAFPDTPFTLEGHGADRELIQYLNQGRDRSYFSYFSESSWEKVQALKPEAELRRQYDCLRELWPLVLTDALRTLKQHDSREWDRDNPGMGTFFHEGSLGVTELREVLAGFTEFEGLMAGASPERYRDHFAHAFRVWLLGHALLAASFGWGLYEGTEGSLGIAEIEWQCMWAMASLCHDVGYPLAEIQNVNRRTHATLRQLGLSPAGEVSFVFSQQMLPFHDTIIKLIASKPVPAPAQDGHLTHLQPKYYFKLLKSLDLLQHGIVSAVLISRALVYFLESDLSLDPFSPLAKEDARQFLIRREILRAIASHTCQDIYHLRFDTLAMVLYLVDELQCWGRPTLEEASGAMGPREGFAAEVRTFSPRRIEITIHTPDELSETPSEDEVKRVIRPLEKLHRILRLAVGTRTLRDALLDFRITPKSGSEARFLLSDGKIQKTPRQWFSPTHDE